jgi:outer membrane lipoprotein SlyB
MTRDRLRFASIAVALAAICAGAAALAQTAPAAPPSAAPPQGVAPATCADCGQVQSIRLVEEKGRGTGVGAVAGGVLGGVLGHQIGSGRGNTVATIAGAAGGAYVGNKVEQNRNAKSYWTVTLQMDGGKTRTFTYSHQPTVHEGDRVKLVDGGKRLALLAN